MATSITNFSRSPGKLWVDYLDYAGHLLARGQIPWLDQASFAAFHAKAQGLFRSGVISLPVSPIVGACIEANPDLLHEMRSKTRLMWPLRRLLDDTGLRAAIVSLLEPLRAANASLPLVLMLPSPARWTSLAWELAHGSPPETEIGIDETGNAAVYISDFLRALSGTQIDAVVLKESAGRAAMDDHASAYEPIVNKARHYRWELGVIDTSLVTRIPGHFGFEFQISSHLGPTPGGRMVQFGPDHASPVSPLAIGQFHYAVVRRGAAPEQLLQWLQSLRESQPSLQAA